MRIPSATFAFLHRGLWLAYGVRVSGNTLHIMPRGDKSAYTDKQKRQAEHIEESEKKQGRSTSSAERIAWATVNKQDGGGKKKGRSAAKK